MDFLFGRKHTVRQIEISTFSEEIRFIVERESGVKLVVETKPFVPEKICPC